MSEKASWEVKDLPGKMGETLSGGHPFFWCHGTAIATGGHGIWQGAGTCPWAPRASSIAPQDPAGPGLLSPKIWVYLGVFFKVIFIFIESPGGSASVPHSSERPGLQGEGASL